MSLDADSLEDLRAFVRAQVRGFGDLDDLPTDAADYMDGIDGLTDAQVQQVISEEVAALKAEEPTWPSPTDNDRVDAAFAALSDRGVLAEQDYWCCQTCGHAAAADEVSERGLRGYVFYHQQDTESAVDGGGLFLAFGTGKPDAEADVAIASEAVAALREQGLTVSWDGTVRQRPYVEITWQRRRFS